MNPGLHHRRQSIRSLLTTAGAALAGAGVGGIIWFSLGPIAWALVVVGLVSCLLGLLANRRSS